MTLPMPMPMPMPNARTGMLREFFSLKASAEPAGSYVPGIFLSADPAKEKQKEKQKRKQDTCHELDAPPDEATLDEDGVIGEAERPVPISEKPESCQK